jgi:hypothetical protein
MKKKQKIKAKKITPFFCRAALWIGYTTVNSAGELYCAPLDAVFFLFFQSVGSFIRLRFFHFVGVGLAPYEL